MASGLEFAVNDASGEERIFSSFDKACGFAVGIAASTGRNVHVDVLVHSRSAAKAWAGEYGTEVYDEDPDASVFQRIVVRAEDRGRIA